MEAKHSQVYHGTPSVACVPHPAYLRQQWRFAGMNCIMIAVKRVVITVSSDDLNWLLKLKLQ